MQSPESDGPVEEREPVLSAGDRMKEAGIGLLLSTLVFAIAAGMAWGGFVLYERSGGGVGFAWLGFLAITMVSLLLGALGLYYLGLAIHAFVAGLLLMPAGHQILGVIVIAATIAGTGLVVAFVDIGALRPKQWVAFLGLPFFGIVAGLILIATGRN